MNFGLFKDCSPLPNPALPIFIVFQEDISKLRRKIEKAKKPAETVLNGDDILNEEINDYKVVWMNTLFTPGVIQVFKSATIKLNWAYTTRF